MWEQAVLCGHLPQWRKDTNVPSNPTDSCPSFNQILALDTIQIQCSGPVVRDSIMAGAGGGTEPPMDRQRKREEELRTAVLL